MPWKRRTKLQTQWKRTGLRMLRGKNAVWRARQKAEKIQQKMRKIWQKTEKILKRTSCMWIRRKNWRAGRKKEKGEEGAELREKRTKEIERKKAWGKSPGSSQEVLQAGCL